MAYARIREFKAPGVPLKEQWLDLASRAYDQVTIIGALVLMVAALTLDLMVAPNEVSQGVVQRIFYVHVPSAWIAFLAFFLVLVCSVRYLMTRARRWDIYAHACAEVGIVFCTLVLITGPIWAKPIWGVWWTWDARLTLTLILWFVYLAYLMIRAQDLEPDKKARYAAVLGIVGALSIPINHFSVLLWRTLHPKPVVIAEEGFGKGLAHPMFLIALGVTLLAL
ncbi:MAG: cytochrome c biogenesis protein, partial [Nitrospinota bacterium]